MAENIALAGQEPTGVRVRATASDLVNQVSSVVLGKEQEIQLACACLLAGGHLLIEDVPGVGKTLLAHATAAALGLDFRRVQFTSDLLPADITGAAVLESESGTFRFHPGPLFAGVVLADEVNRATPKTQSALLEAMEENQVTVDGVSHALPDPFFVIATQNPREQTGTYPLPESQLDRFLMRIALGYPSPSLERKLLRGGSRRDAVRHIEAVADPAQLIQLRASLKDVPVSEALLDYVQAIVAFTRDSGEFRQGLSPRAAVDLVACGRAWALIQGHGGVHPEDIQAVFGSVAGHRLAPADALQASADEACPKVLEAVPVP